MVNIAEANELGKDMIDQYLPRMGYKLTWDRSTKRAGSCSYRYREIILSAVAVEQYSWDQFETLMYHEIAHALTPNEEKSHGPEWKRKCIELGGDGKQYCKQFYTGKMEITPVGVVVMAAMVYAFHVALSPVAAAVLATCFGVWLTRRAIRALKPAATEHGMVMVDGEWVTR